MSKKIISFLSLTVIAIVSLFAMAACNIGGTSVTPVDVSKQLSAPSGLRLDSGSLCWNPVEFASKYTVSIDGKEDYCEDYKYALTNLKDGEHIFKVRANGDGILYSSSAWSAELKETIKEGAKVSTDVYGNFDELTKKESFLGYGFDVINSSVFSDKYVKKSFTIFDTDELMNQRLLKVDSKRSVVEEIKSSEMEDFMQQWNVNANVDVSWGKKRVGGSVSVGVYYSGGYEHAKSKYFHSISITNQKFYIVLQSDMETYRSIISDGFEKDLYSDMSPADLFNLYGTHFITSAVMGGKINSYYLYTSEEEKKYNDISAEVSTNVRYFTTHVDVDVWGGYRETAKREKIDIKNSLEVIGGDDFGMLSDSDIPKNYAAWEKSLDNHASLMGITDSSSLIPIWNLIDASKDNRIYEYDYYDEETGMRAKGQGSRAQQLQAYFMVYGIDSYNALMSASGLPEIIMPEEITNVKINGVSSATCEYEVYAGNKNAISFEYKPSNATGFTKSASLSTQTDLARINNDDGLDLEVDLGMPNDTVLQLVLSYGSARKVIQVRVIELYTVTFRSNGGDEIQSYRNIRYGDQIDEPPMSKREGYIFKGWYTDTDFTEGSEYKFGNQAIKGNITLYAKWEKYYPTITVIHNIEERDNDVYKCEYNKTYNLPQDLTEYGYIFKGYYSDREMLIAYDESTAYKADATVYAKWEKNTYTVTFNSNGGTQIESQKVNYKELAKKPENPTKLGSTFGGWCKDGDCLQSFDFYNDVITKNITLYAYFTVNGIEIYFDTDGGNEIEKVGIEAGNSLGEKLRTPEKTGYTFKGWYVGDTRIYSNTVLYENATLTAKWNINTYTVQFDANGGSGNMDDQKFIYDVAQKLFTNTFTKSGYLFLGWAKRANGATDYYDEQIVKNLASNGEVVLYAVWAVDPYSVSRFISGIASDSNGENVYAIYRTIDTTPWMSEYPTSKIIVDWSDESETNLLKHEQNNSDGKTYTKFVIKNITELYLIGAKDLYFNNLSFIISGYDVGRKLEIHMIDFNFVSNKSTAIGINNSDNIKLTIDIVGNCSISTTYSGGDIIGQEGKIIDDITFIGSGSMSISAGNGSNASSSGLRGQNGGVGIYAGNLTVNMTGALTVIGGNGGKGENGYNGSDGQGNDQPGSAGGRGGDGGNGASAIICKHAVINSELTVKAGSGGNAGVGGNGGNGTRDSAPWSDGKNVGGNGGNGGNGGSCGQALACTDSIINHDITKTEGVVGVGGRGGDGGNGGQGNWKDGHGGYGGAGGVGGWNGNNTVKAADGKAGTITY